MKDRAIGPNVKRLVVHRMSQQAVPAGGGLADGLKFLSDPKGVSDAARTATEWVEEAIVSVRNAMGRNPWLHSSDEDIAAEILRRLKKIEEQIK